MYAIVYTKTALKDIPKLKAAHLDGKAKDLIALLSGETHIPLPNAARGLLRDTLRAI